MNMENRSKELLKKIIEIYIEKARPVGSQYLVSYFKISSATIRNEMLVLEQEGYITQPHISAGRIPTILGYQYYLDNLLNINKISKKEENELKYAYKNDIRDLAKLLVDKTNLAVIIGFNPHNLYFTGLFNLFSQVEFEDYKMVLSMSQVVDSLEKAISKIYSEIKDTEVILGPNNPFNENFSVAVTSLPTKKLLAIMGPNRMDYNKTLGLLNSVVKIIK